MTSGIKKGAGVWDADNKKWDEQMYVQFSDGHAASVIPNDNDDGNVDDIVIYIYLNVTSNFQLVQD